MGNVVVQGLTVQVRTMQRGVRVIMSFMVMGHHIHGIQPNSQEHKKQVADWNSSSTCNTDYVYASTLDSSPERWVGCASSSLPTSFYRSVPATALATQCMFNSSQHYFPIIRVYKD